MTEIQKADPHARRQTRWLALVGMVVGMVLLWLLTRYRESLRVLVVEHSDTLIDNPLLVGLGMLVLMSPVLGCGVYCWVLGRRIVKARRFPPPGMAVGRDTPVVRDGAAVARGRLVQAAGGVLVMAGLAVCILVAGILGVGLR